MTRDKLNFIPKFDESKGIEFGIYTLGDHIKNPHTGEILSEIGRASCRERV